MSDLEEHQVLAELREYRLPLRRARRRCLQCWSWNPPLTEWCLRCSTPILRMEAAE